MIHRIAIGPLTFATLYTLTTWCAFRQVNARSIYELLAPPDDLYPSYDNNNNNVPPSGVTLTRFSTHFRQPRMFSGNDDVIRKPPMFSDDDDVIDSGGEIQVVTIPRRGSWVARGLDHPEQAQKNAYKSSSSWGTPIEQDDDEHSLPFSEQYLRGGEFGERAPRLYDNSPFDQLYTDWQQGRDIRDAILHRGDLDWSRGDFGDSRVKRSGGGEDQLGNDQEATISAWNTYTRLLEEEAKRRENNLFVG